MFKVVKKLKALKSHLNKLNWRNGNLFEKVRVCRENLKEAQVQMEKFPHDLHKKAIEAKCLAKYIEAFDDEENILFQMAKVDWLSKGDGNNSFFHKIIKSRRNQHTILSVCNEEGQSFEGKDEEALRMIKDVSSNEIKEAMFDIGEVKAPCPDGFSSAFFIHAWSVVRDDICNAFKEFFKTGKLLREAKGPYVSLPLYSSHGSIFFDDGQESGSVYGWNDSNSFGMFILLDVDNVVGLKYINGERHGYFKSGRGLRQGDPMSPYLFTLVMEVFSFMMAKKVDQCGEFKFHKGCKELKITHLSLADDLLVLSHGDTRSVKVIKDALMEFSACSSLIPNMEKSTTFFGSVDMGERQRILEIMILKLEVCQKTPINCISASLNANILGLCGNDSKNSRERNQCPKCEGGLGIKWLDTWNEVLLIKHIWNIVSKKVSLWVKWINIIKLKGRSLLQIDVEKNDSSTWKSILELREKVKPHIISVIGNGKTTSMWHDNQVNGMNLFLKSPVPQFLNGNEDRVKWINKRGNMVDFSIKTTWLDMMDVKPNINWWKMVWKGLENKMNGVVLPNDWEDIVTTISNNPNIKSIWSILSRIILATSVYYIWKEGNSRIFTKVKLSSETVLQNITENVRLQLMGLTMKNTIQVQKVAADWNIKFKTVLSS
ncbi:RNA-directed DNA polymerase, eukaryota, reverse transcriptase zinc-binding domain protein [Tanacetum coccineum]